MANSSEIRSTRITGLAFVVGGLMVCYMTMVSPVLEAAKTGTLGFSEKAVFFSPLILFFGVLLLLLPADERKLRVEVDGKFQGTLLSKLIFGTYFAVSMAVSFAWMTYVKHLGYQVL